MKLWCKHILIHLYKISESFAEKSLIFQEQDGSYLETNGVTHTRRGYENYMIYPRPF